jgi:hypothetical protein
MTKNTKLFSLTNKAFMLVGGLILIIIAIIIYLIFNHHQANDTVLTPASVSTKTTKQTTDTSKQPSKVTTTTSTPSTTTSPSPTQTTYYPAAPTKLIGTPISPTEITLSWTASDGRGGTVVGYYVVRDNTVIDKVTSTSYSDTKLTANTAYTYSVEAINSGGILSAKSTTIAIQTPPVFAVTLGTGSVSPAPPTQSFLGDPIDFTFPVTANTAGTITYEIVDTYGNVMQTPTTLTFGAAGTQDITLDFITPENWPAINDYQQSADATLEILTPTAINSSGVTFDWNFE